MKKQYVVEKTGFFRKQIFDLPYSLVFIRFYANFNYNLFLALATFQLVSSPDTNFVIVIFFAGRSATYSVTQDGDVNSILDGLDMSMFDKKDLERKNKIGL